MLWHVLFLFICLFSFSFAKPKMAIVVDDAGFNTQDCQYWAKQKVPITIAVIPGQAYSKTCAKIVKENGQELMIHFPWTPLGFNYQKRYPIHIDQNMKSPEIKQMLSRAIASVPGSDGINNHMGSELSINDYVLQEFMKGLAKYKENKYFLDSSTIRGSRAEAYAAKYGIKTTNNNVFLDGMQLAKYIRSKFSEAIREAKKDGQVIAICHAGRGMTKKTVPKLIAEYKSDIEFVFVSGLVK